MASPTRRNFLGAASLAGAAPLMGAPGKRVIGANDRIQIGSIGVGGNGTGMLRHVLKRAEIENDVRSVAVCDVYSRFRDRAATMAELPEKDRYNDYQELLARDDVDAVIISTPDHWHAPMAIDAMAAGKDVYLQKPMTLTIDEARRTAEAAKKHGRVLQVGSQHLSDKRYHKAKEMIDAGEIGQVLWAQTTYSRNSKVGEWNYYVDEEASPKTIDWKRWLGPAPERSFSAERYFRWRKYWDYSGGIATDLFYHRLGPVLHMIGREFPTRVSGSGGIYIQKDREVPDTYATTVEYPNFYVTLSSSMANAAANRHFETAIYGHKGTMLFGRDSVIVEREPLFDPYAANRRGARIEYPVEDHDMSWEHMENWLTSIRKRTKPVLDPHFGYQVMVAIKLGVDSYREGALKLFDPTAEKEISKAPARPGYEGDGKNAPDSPYRKRV